jgi:hypothetical protein
MLRNALLQVTNASECALSASVVAPSVAPKNRFALFPSLPLVRLSLRASRTARPLPRGGLIAPRATARRSRVAPSVIFRQGLRKSLCAPCLPFLRLLPPLLRLRLRRVAFAHSAWLKSPSRFAPLCTAFSLAPARPPIRPCPRSVPRWGALSPLPFGSGASGGRVPRPPPQRGKLLRCFWVCVRSR